MRSVLVCGATGFIGRNLVERLAAHPGYRVTAVYHRTPPFELPGLAWVQADLTLRVDVERVVAGHEVIVQAAAVTSGAGEIVQRPFIHITDNVIMNALLFEAARAHGVEQLLFFSCSIMYPSSPHPQKEEDYDPARPLHPRYLAAGSTKLYLEQLCAFYAGLGPCRFTVLRHSNIYGPHDKFDLQRSHMFGATVTKVLTSRDGTLPVWGDGQEARDLLYVDDLIDGVLLALERQPGRFGLYNCGSGQGVRVLDLAQQIIAAAGRPLTIRLQPDQPTIPVTILLDAGKAQRELGWQPKVDLATGIRRTLDWWHAHVG